MVPALILLTLFGQGVFNPTRVPIDRIRVGPADTRPYAIVPVHRLISARWVEAEYWDGLGFHEGPRRTNVICVAEYSRYWYTDEGPERGVTQRNRLCYSEAGQAELLRDPEWAAWFAQVTQ